MMNDLFSDMLDRSVIIFLDDILIFSQSVEEHGQHLGDVLRCLSDQKLFAKASECEIAHKTTEFVGHVVTKHGIAPMEAKVKTTNEWTTLDSVHDAIFSRNGNLLPEIYSSLCQDLWSCA